MSGGRLSIASTGEVEIVNDGGTDGATLTDVNLQNCGEISIDGDTTLTLSGDAVHGGAIDGTNASGDIVASTIDVTGDSTFCDVGLSHGDLTVESDVTLTPQRRHRLRRRQLTAPMLRAASLPAPSTSPATQPSTASPCTTAT